MTGREAKEIVYDRCQHCKETEEALKVLREGCEKYEQLIADVKEVIDGLSKSADDAKSRFDEAHDDLDIEKYAKYGAKMQTYIEIEGVLRRVVEKYEVQ